MRKLSQKELIHEGFGSFLKSLGKSAVKKVASDLAKDSPALSGIAGSVKTAIKAGKSDEKKIKEYLLDYNKMMIDKPQKGKGGRYIVKTAEIEYDVDGEEKQGKIDPSPMILKIDGDRIKRLDRDKRGSNKKVPQKTPVKPVKVYKPGDSVKWTNNKNRISSGTVIKSDETNTQIKMVNGTLTAVATSKLKKI